MRRLICVFACLASSTLMWGALSGFGAPAAVDQAQAPADVDVGYADREIGLSFPKALGELSFAGHAGFDAPELGYQIRYSGPDKMRLDVFVYHKGLAKVPTGHNDKLIVDEVAQAEGDLREAERQGYYLDVKKLGSGVYPEGQKDGVRFQTARFQFRHSAKANTGLKGTLVSEIYVRGFKDRFVKVRVTYATADEKGALAARDKALTELAKLLTAK